MINRCRPLHGFERRTTRELRSTALMVLLAVGFVLLTSLPSLAASGGKWWDSAWLYRTPVTVQNASSTTNLPAQYSVQLTMDTTLPIRTGQLLPNCSDLRASTAR
jgi:hypothetical protein